MASAASAARAELLLAVVGDVAELAFLLEVVGEVVGEVLLGQSQRGRVVLAHAPAHQRDARHVLADHVVVARLVAATREVHVDLAAVGLHVGLQEVRHALGQRARALLVHGAERHDLVAAQHRHDARLRAEQDEQLVRRERLGVGVLAAVLLAEIGLEVVARLVVRDDGGRAGALLDASALQQETAHAAMHVADQGLALATLNRVVVVAEAQLDRVDLVGELRPGLAELLDRIERRAVPGIALLPLLGEQLAFAAQRHVERAFRIGRQLGHVADQELGHAARQALGHLAGRDGPGGAARALGVEQDGGSHRDDRGGKDRPLPGRTARRGRCGGSHGRWLASHTARPA
jgi:hypothetical protein